MEQKRCFYCCAWWGRYVKGHWVGMTRRRALDRFKDPGFRFCKDTSPTDRHPMPRGPRLAVMQIHCHNPLQVSIDRWKAIFLLPEKLLDETKCKLETSLASTSCWPSKMSPIIFDAFICASADKSSKLQMTWGRTRPNDAIPPQYSLPIQKIQEIRGKAVLSYAPESRKKAHPQVQSCEDFSRISISSSPLT